MAFSVTTALWLATAVMTQPSSSVATLVVTSSSSSLRRRYLNYIYLSGHTPYRVVWEMQKKLMNEHIEAQDHDQLGGRICVGSVILCEHTPVYTLGTATTAGSGPFSTRLADGTLLAYDTFHVERAGQATYHGPGQLVCYPIVDLTHFQRDINWYLRELEQAVIDTLGHFNVNARRIKGDGMTGVWTSSADGSGSDSKIAALGIKLRRWVTMHGVSINVNPDLRYFSNIIPCGISDATKTVATLDQFVPGVTVGQVLPVFLDEVSALFDVDLLPLGEERNQQLVLEATSRSSSDSDIASLGS